MIKNYQQMAFVMAAIFAGSGAWANDVYIEQIGDNTVVNVTQYGSANKVEGLLPGDPAIIAGDGNTVSISQIGVGNTLKLSVGTNNIGGLGSGVAVTTTADGSGNTQTIRRRRRENAYSGIWSYYYRSVRSCMD